jgi:hypothetical protein
MQEAVLASAIIYLDESGDLGWSFSKPYRSGGSSRFLTIAALCVPVEKSHLPKRLTKKLYIKHKWPSDEEKKWASMKDAEKVDFATRANVLCSDNVDILLKSITVKKENVFEHIRQDANLLYNYMIKILLLQYMKNFDVVTLVPDPRSIKVKSGNSLHEYLQGELWFTEKSNTKLVTTPTDSRHCYNLQFADMVSGIVQSRHEDNKNSPFQIIAKKIDHKTLYF